MHQVEYTSIMKRKAKQKKRSQLLAQELCELTKSTKAGYDMHVCRSGNSITIISEDAVFLRSLPPTGHGFKQSEPTPTSAQFDDSFESLSSHSPEF